MIINQTAMLDAIIDAGIISDFKPRFAIGDKVTARAFIDCFGKQIKATPGLTVTKITKVETGDIPTYFRVLANEEKGLGCVEGAERFFVLDTFETDQRAWDERTEAPREQEIAFPFGARD